MISIVPYSGEYKVGVLAVLKRNFPWMARYSDEWLSRWLSPLIEYHWDDDPDISDVPFKYGAVVLDGDNVVGFFGTIYSYRLIDGKKYLCLNFSTWCADAEYRIHTFSALKKLCATADILTDFTPNEPSREIITKMFGFKYAETKCFNLCPVPLLHSAKVSVRFINDPSELKDPEQSAIFAEHQKYGLKCAEFERDGERGCIFYYFHASRKLKLYRIVRTVKIYNRKLFTENLREIARKIQKHEGFFIHFCVDSCFIDGKFSCPLYFVRKAYRCVRTKENINFQLDFLYSELSMLDI